MPERQLWSNERIIVSVRREHGDNDDDGAGTDSSSHEASDSSSDAPSDAGPYFL